MTSSHISDINPSEMKIAVGSAGAMGSMIGGWLIEERSNVVLVDLWRKHVDVINQKRIIDD